MTGGAGGGGGLRGEWSGRSGTGHYDDGSHSSGGGGGGGGGGHSDHINRSGWEQVVHYSLSLARDMTQQHSLSIEVLLEYN